MSFFCLKNLTGAAWLLKMIPKTMKNCSAVMIHVKYNDIGADHGRQVLEASPQVCAELLAAMPHPQLSEAINTGQHPEDFMVEGDVPAKVFTPLSILKRLLRWCVQPLS